MLVSELLWQLFNKSTGVCTDTRLLRPGQLFFALQGENFNGNLFASKALELGALAVVVSDPNLKGDDQYILVENTLLTLQALATQYRAEFQIPVIGITGSNGKTTTKELMASVLKTTFRVHFTQGNLNNHLGVPLTILSMPEDTEIAIIEMGANHQGEIRELCQIAQPTHGLITNIGKAHLEGFGGYEGVKKAKSELYDYLSKHQGLIFYNRDDEVLHSVLPAQCRTISYGTFLETPPDYIFELVESEPFLHLKMISPLQENIRSQLYGLYNVPNIMAAAVVGHHFQVTISAIQNGVYEYIPNNQRSQWVSWQGHQVMMDAYNANPSSMALAIQTFRKHHAAHKILILGDMRELGEWSLPEHQTIVDKINEDKWAEVILIGDWFGHTRHTFHHFATTDEAKTYVNAQTWPPSTILLKGSRGMKLEKIIQQD